LCCLWVTFLMRSPLFSPLAARRRKPSPLKPRDVTWTAPGVTDRPNVWPCEHGGSTPNRRLAHGDLPSIGRRRVRLAGVATTSLHGFTRAFALASLRNGMDVFSLQRLTGRVDLTVLWCYLRQTGGDLREAHRKAGPVDNSLRLGQSAKS
jgi:hypothetical protein